MARVKMTSLCVASVAWLVLAAPTLSSPIDMTVPDSFTSFDARALDQAWVNPQFDASQYKTIAIKWSEFDYRPGKKRFNLRDRHENYELSAKAKARLEEQANVAFVNELKRIENYQLVTLEDADAQTLIVHLSISDFVNNVPNRQQLIGQTQFFARQFGAATLTVELLDAESSSSLFKGQVRTNIQPVSINLELADVVTANRRTRLQFERWAKDLRKNITKMALL